MLENRSFDHLLGFSGISGRDARTGAPTSVDGLTGDETQLDSSGRPHFVIRGAPPALTLDLPHEAIHIKRQLLGAGLDDAPFTDDNVKSTGFLLGSESRGRYHEDAITAFAPEEVPVFTALAREFVVCDRWFSPMPGPTFPNRMFAHAATSGGITGSPGGADLVSGIVSGYQFENGHIFERLDRADLEWAVYAYDIVENMSVLLDGVAPWEISEYSLFDGRVRGGRYRTAYTFIEPHYDAITGHFVGGDSMHPLNHVGRAERLVKEVYESIRRSPVWPRSVLIVTFDEHGGFYDHVPPPAAPAPGDVPGAEGPLSPFLRLGVRVPAIIISPLIPRNVVDHTVYEHCSILKTLSMRFGLESLTARDAAASSLEHLFTLREARTDAPMSLPEPSPILGPAVVSSGPEGDPPAVLGPSERPFALAAAITEAKLRGPTRWQDVHRRAAALDVMHPTSVAAYMRAIRARARAARR